MNAIAMSWEAAQEAIDTQGALQQPGELAELCRLLVSRLPGEPRILEVGLGYGGTVWLWRRLWPDAVIVGVDRRLAPCESCERRKAHSSCPRARIAKAVDEFVLADSVRDAERVLAMLPEQGFDFVHIDADHSYEAVCSDFAHYGPLAPIVALHDTLAYPGVRNFLAEIRAVSGSGLDLVEIGEEPLGYGYGVILR